MLEEESVAMAALWGTVHLLRVMVNRGLVSPNEVETIYGGMLEGFQLGDKENAARAEVFLQQPFAEIRQWAKDRWVGGPNDPEDLHGGEGPASDR